MRRGCDQWATDTTHLHEINDSSVSPHSTSLCAELMRWVFTMQCVMLLLLLYSLSAAAASRPRGDSIHRYCYAFKHLYNLHTFFFLIMRHRFWIYMGWFLHKFTITTLYSYHMYLYIEFILLQPFWNQIEVQLHNSPLGLTNICTTLMAHNNGKKSAFYSVLTDEWDGLGLDFYIHGFLLSQCKHSPFRRLLLKQWRIDGSPGGESSI